MSKLNLIDQVFYKLDKAGLFQIYMGGATVIDASASPYKLTGIDIINHLAARFENVPVLRKKIIEDPLKLGNVQLVDDPEFNIRNHFFHTTLDTPGDYDQLTKALESFSARQMDYDIPLWHFEIIDGLKDGHIAIASHIHHSMMDGMGAVKTLSSIYDLKPVAIEKPSNKKWEPDDSPSAYTLIREGLSDSVKRLFVKTPAFISNNRSELIKSARQSLASFIQPESETDEPSSAPNPKTSLDVIASPEVVVSFKVLSLQEIKNLSKSLGCTINDIGLFICSLALEHYFNAIGEDVDFDLVAAMPVSTRTDNDSSTGNILAGGTINLHNTVSDHAKRLKAINKDSHELKQSSRPDTGINAADLMDLIHPSLLDLAVLAIPRLINNDDNPLKINTVLSNVPGAREQTYIAGAPVAYTIPMIPRLGGLSCGLTSSGDSLTIGFHGCAQAIKDKNLFTEGVEVALEALKSLADSKIKGTKTTTKKSTPKKKPTRKAVARRRTSQKTTAAKKDNASTDKSKKSN